jgi:hypothetical protein
MEAMPAQTREILLREQWLDKLWLYLFDSNSAGLMSPGQIRREHRNRERVRQLEMASILEAEKEINDIHRGLKEIDDGGNLVDTPPVDLVATHKVIENSAIEQYLDLSLDSPAAMIRSVVKEISVRDLERSLNLRKIAILAETEIINSPVSIISTKPVNAEWMVRWRESAQMAYNAELQLLWAKTLIRELATPGYYSMGLMAVLKQLSLDDLEALRIVSKYAFVDFIYEASNYFSTVYHRNLFDVMEDLGLLSQQTSAKSLPSQSTDCYSLLLTCHNKALKISASHADIVLTLPVLKLTRVGRQLLPLCGSETDLAYLFDLARFVKQQGFNVALGDWETLGNKGHFIERIGL